MEELKNKGNEFFKSQNYDEALKKYNNAVELVDDDQRNLSVLHSNISATYCKLENYGLALEHAVTSTKTQPDWYKAWYRLSLVLYKLEKYEQSDKSIEKCIECCNKDNIEHKFVSDLKKDILEKLNKDVEEVDYNVIDDNVIDNNNTGMPNMAGMPKMADMEKKLMPMMNEILKNDKIKNKLSSKEFQEKIMKNQSNPFEMLADPDMRYIIGEMMKNSGNK
jgi:tetratricopeptide (TPR) repeat protein